MTLPSGQQPFDGADFMRLENVTLEVEADRILASLPVRAIGRLVHS